MTNQSINLSINQTSRESINQSINRTINQRIINTFEQRIGRCNQSTNQLIEHNCKENASGIKNPLTYTSQTPPSNRCSHPPDYTPCNCPHWRAAPPWSRPATAWSSPDRPRTPPPHRWRWCWWRHGTAAAAAASTPHCWWNSARPRGSAAPGARPSSTANTFRRWWTPARWRHPWTRSGAGRWRCGAWRRGRRPGHSGRTGGTPRAEWRPGTRCWPWTSGRGWSWPPRRPRWRPSWGWAVGRGRWCRWSRSCCWERRRHWRGAWRWRRGGTSRRRCCWWRCTGRRRWPGKWRRCRRCRHRSRTKSGRPGRRWS